MSRVCSIRPAAKPTTRCWPALLEQAQSSNLIAPGAPRELAARFLALQWGGLLLQLLLRVANRPTEAEAEAEAKAKAGVAVRDFMKLYGCS